MGWTKMKQQAEIMESFIEAPSWIHGEFGALSNLLEQGIDEAAEMGKTCTDEWCLATEHALDDFANMIFSISEPHWATDGKDSEKIRTLQHRVHDLYEKYKNVKAKSL